MSSRIRAIAAFVLALVASAVHAADIDFRRALAFEAEHGANFPGGWGGGPEATIHPDSTVVHGGRWSVRLERVVGSESNFTTVTKAIPVEFAGKAIELRGWLRTRDVIGFAGLWLRVDGASGMLQFDNMQGRDLNGTTEWTEYRITLPLDPKAREIVFGALVSGEGTVWVDDLELLVDGVSVDEAPRVERSLTVFDKDHEFDESSGITLANADKTQIANLALLGKVWGFLKYHHPAVTGGTVHWDYELFRALPAVLAARNRRDGQDAILTWASKLGEPPACSPCASPPKEAHFESDLRWLREEKHTGKKLSAYLQTVYERRHRSGDQFYVSLVRGVANPSFDNEPGYERLEDVDAGYRLLALFRFWNSIQYWFPYRDVIGSDWKGVLPEFIPRIVAAVERDAYRLTLIELIARVNDTHANLWSGLDARPPRGKCTLPVVVRFVEGKALVTELWSGVETPLRVGDVIEKIDGRTVSTLIKEWGPYYAASNETARLSAMTRTLTTGDCVPCQLHVARVEGALDLEAPRVVNDRPAFRHPHDRPGETFQLISEEVAYLKLSSVKQGETTDYIENAHGTRGLIIDIRNYPSAFMPFELGRHLVSQRTPFVTFTAGDLSNPGAFQFGPNLSIDPAEPHYQGRVAILVDDASISQAEYTAMALRSAPNAKVIGSTTLGADGNVSKLSLPGGERTQISGIGVFYPDRRPTQRIGILPDIEARPTIAGMRAGRDEVLEAAIRYILGEGVPEDVVVRMAKP